MADAEQVRDAYEVHHRIAENLEAQGVDPDCEIIAPFVQEVSLEFAALLAGVRDWPKEANDG